MTPTSMPSALPTPNSAAIDDANNQMSPSMKKPLKKGKGDDLDKYVETLKIKSVSILLTF